MNKEKRKTKNDIKRTKKETAIIQKTDNKFPFVQLASELDALIKNFQSHLLKTTSLTKIKPNKDKFFKNINSFTGTASKHPNVSTRSKLRADNVNSEFSYIQPLGSRYKNQQVILRKLQDEVKRCVSQNKVFTVVGSLHHPVRQSLLSRNWLEKHHSSYKLLLKPDLQSLSNSTIASLLSVMNKTNWTLCSGLIASKLLKNSQVDFYWGPGCPQQDQKITTINRIRKMLGSYVTKDGLKECNAIAHWYQKENVLKFRHPRTYNLSKQVQVLEFIEDFRHTAAVSLLKWVEKTYSDGNHRVLSPAGTVPIDVFDFAVSECCKLIQKQQHVDIDEDIPKASDFEWRQFLNYVQEILYFAKHFQGHMHEEQLFNKALVVLEHLKIVYPFYAIDGMMNVWILKPNFGARGRGIQICRSLDYILKTVKAKRGVEFVIQKYIENPMLIYGSKFDIRQWFLISNTSPLEIWIYRDSYLRFSAQTYNIRKLHESIHLTNNAVQSKYKTNALDPALPPYNMWDSNRFQEYLTDLGHPNLYKKHIFPAIKQCILAAILMHQDRIVPRKNSFEVHGADFMITENFETWLLEINACPAMNASTPVTRRMCPRALEDIVKVMVDHKNNRRISTGAFELLYRDQPFKIPLQNLELRLEGKHLGKSYFFNEAPAPTKPILSSLGSFLQDGKKVKKTLTRLLSLIVNEKLKIKSI